MPTKTVYWFIRGSQSVVLFWIMEALFRNGEVKWGLVDSSGSIYLLVGLHILIMRPWILRQIGWFPNDITYLMTQIPERSYIREWLEMRNGLIAVYTTSNTCVNSLQYSGQRVALCSIAYFLCLTSRSLGQKQGSSFCCFQVLFVNLQFLVLNL